MEKKKDNHIKTTHTEVTPLPSPPQKRESVISLKYTPELHKACCKRAF